MPHRSNARKLIHQRVVHPSRKTGSRVLDKVYSESGLSTMNFPTYMEHGINFQRSKAEMKSVLLKQSVWYTQTTTTLLDALRKPANYVNYVFERKLLLTTTRGLQPKHCSRPYWKNKKTPTNI